MLCVCVCEVECVCVCHCALPQCSSVVYTVHKRDDTIYKQILDNHLFVFINIHSFGKQIMTEQSGEWCVLVW